MNITNELRKYVRLNLPHYIRNELFSIADSIDEECQKLLDELHTLADSSVLLPLDVDGVPIQIGDMIIYENYTKPKEVVALVPPSMIMVDDGPRYADRCRHYHEPTVKDLLQDMVVEWDSAPDGEDKAHVIKYYAEKLLLAANYKKRQ